MTQIAVLWKEGPVQGTLTVTHGSLHGLKIATGKGRVGKDHFNITSKGPCRLEAALADTSVAPGSDASRVILATSTPFAFFLRDVTEANPILLPALGVAITPLSDGRSYPQVESAIRDRGGQRLLDQIAGEPEETVSTSRAATRALHGPTWLGLSRDIRLFQVFYNAASQVEVIPRRHGDGLPLPETDNKNVTYHFPVGRGEACVEGITRRLEDGCLPILHHEVNDAGIRYHMTAFVALRQHKLMAKQLRGTHYLVADGFGAGHMFTEDQSKEFEKLKAGELDQPDAPVLFLKMAITNPSPTPRYAWIKAPVPGPLAEGEGVAFDGKTGFASFRKSGRVFCLGRLDAHPLPQTELALLLPPKGTVAAEFFIPYQPLSDADARALATVDLEHAMRECRNFWRQKLASAGRISVPDPVVNDMIHAGLLHLDLVTYGREPDQALTATIGVYSAIGSESAPIIQFFDSMGWHKVAERSLEYFLEKQHPNGFMQNFGGYMLETGPALWSMGEHYRYTRDDRWVKRIAPKLVKACEFMLEWRKRNMKPELRGRGYGLQEGKVGDPNIPTHYFMLNGYAFLGMSRVAEMLKHVNPKQSRRWELEAEAFRQDIVAAFREAVGRSPVVPLGDGTWVQTAPPWAEATGPVCLYAEPGEYWTHGSYLCHDSLVSPLYLVFQEVLPPNDPIVESLLHVHAEMMAVRNVATCQPYYARHDYVHLRRGEVKAYLKTYFNAFAGLADRETYSFWEHYHHASPHKTHEEAWFLMQTRWMLWLEEGTVLKLLAGVPRAWLDSGRRIELQSVASAFGPVTVDVQSKADAGEITATVHCPGKRRPSSVVLRLPHPTGKKAKTGAGGVYDPQKETVTITPFRGSATVTLKF